MFDAARFDIFTRSKTTVFGILVLAAITILPTISAIAQCSTNAWTIAGQFLTINQVGQKHPIKLTVQQNGRTITGTAAHTIETPGGLLKFGGIETLAGQVSGTINGSGFSIAIAWSNGKTGIYDAVIVPGGSLDGKAYEKSSPKVLHVWHSFSAVMCLPPAPVSKTPPAQTPKPKPTPVPAPKPAPAPVPMKVPGIVASQVIFPVPFASIGFVILTWDGGSNHPYAEIWFKINNGPDTFLVEKGKGSIQRPVERGIVYTYILTDAGETLDTVTVVGQ